MLHHRYRILHAANLKTECKLRVSLDPFRLNGWIESVSLNSKNKDKNSVYLASNQQGGGGVGAYSPSFTQLITCKWRSKTQWYRHSSKHVSHCLRKLIASDHISRNHRHLAHKTSVKKSKYQSITHKSCIVFEQRTQESAQSNGKYRKLVQVEPVDEFKVGNLAKYHSTKRWGDG